MMKTSIITFFLALLFFLSPDSYGQKETIDGIKNAIKVGNSKEISRYFNDNIDVTISDEVKSCSKTQAEYIFKDFFRNHPPSGFTVVHQGSSQGGLPYVIGQYTSGKNTYRVWMRIKNTKGIHLIHEISFIKE